MSVTELPADQDQAANWNIQSTWKVGVVVIMILLFLTMAVFSKPKNMVLLNVYAYSTQIEVFTEAIFQDFERAWEAEHGKDLKIKGVFGPSLTLVGDIVLGAPADLAILSHEQHVNYLKLGKVVRENNIPTTVHKTPLVIVTRPGNPLGIEEFADLSRPGLRLIHANPHSSGAGAWAILGEYACNLLQSEHDLEAEQHLSMIWENVKIMAASAREAMTLFELGAGDAFITYEQDARLALARQVDAAIVIPSCTVLTEAMAVIVDKNVGSEERSVAEEFLQYLISDAGQETFIRFQLRPVTLAQDPFPELDQIISVQDLGGWSQVYRELIDELWKQEIEPTLDFKLEVNPYEWHRE
jgi:ABC-type sulfate transport system substrate-binding protein